MEHVFSDPAWWALLKQYGPFVALVGFYVWRDWKREGRRDDRIDALENEMREVILPLVKDTTKVIAQNTAVMERLERHLE